VSTAKDMGDCCFSQEAKWFWLIVSRIGFIMEIRKNLFCISVTILIVSIQNIYMQEPKLTMFGTELFVIELRINVEKKDQM